MSQQGLRQQVFRTYHGVAGNHPYEADLMLGFAVDAITVGTFNERLKKWIDLKLVATHANLPEAMQAYATAKSAGNWSSLGTWTI